MIAAVCMVKDEADIIWDTLTRMSGQVDFMVVADNGSTDGTRDVLASFSAAAPEKIYVQSEPDPAYYQSERMSALSARARDLGAEWVVPFDADEVWLGRGGRIADLLSDLPDGFLIAEATLYDHVATGHDEPGSAIRQMHYRRARPGALPKVACRAVEGLVIHQGNHGASFPGTDHPPTVSNLLNIRHFPYRSVEQMIRKARNGAAAYAATDLPEEVGAHWRGYGRLSDEQIGDVFREFFWSAYPDADRDLVHDPCP